MHYFGHFSIIPQNVPVCDIMSTSHRILIKYVEITMDVKLKIAHRLL